MKQPPWTTLLFTLLLVTALSGCVVSGLDSVVGGAVGLKASGSEANQSAGSAAQEGLVAPDFRLQTLDGKSVSLSQYRGKPVMVNFWATWCGPCRSEMPIMEDRYRQHKADLVILAVEGGDPVREVRKFVSDQDLTFTVLQGTDEVQRIYKVRAYPTSVFIDSEGIIRSIVVGSLNGRALDAELSKIGVK